MSHVSPKLYQTIIIFCLGYVISHFMEEHQEPVEDLVFSSPYFVVVCKNTVYLIPALPPKSELTAAEISTYRPNNSV